MLFGGSIVEGLWNFGQEKPIPVQSLVSSSAGALEDKNVRAKKTIAAWFVKFTRED